jgi:lysosomal acid lipase/cholesteryl ester hydrolase
MRDGGRRLTACRRGVQRSVRRLVVAASLGVLVTGCASMRHHAPSPDLRPCSDGYAYTADGWKLGVRHLRPPCPDPSKMPVVLCHGMGLNGTFWTITDDHMPSQLLARGYEVFIFDFRGSGESARLGPVGAVNAFLRQTPFLEVGEKHWCVDEIVQYDVPAILAYVKNQTGHDRVNWVGHSLGGMLMFPFLELSPESWRIANFVAMGSTIIITPTPQTGMLQANRKLRGLSSIASPGRLGRPLTFMKVKALAQIDQLYYTESNVDRRTVSRFYGYTLEDMGKAALKQLDPYLEFGHFVSADRSIDYADRLRDVTTPIVMVAGDGDVMSDVASTELTFEALGSPDKSMTRFGRLEGHIADYGHCDLVWSRHAPIEVFPTLIDWLDQRQPPSWPGPLASPQTGSR